MNRDLGGISAPRYAACALALLLVLGALGACVPLRNSIAPYDSDPAAAHALEQRAAHICASVRGRDGLPPYPFTTDGCSLWFDNGWQSCCIEHDIDYWCGGSAVDRCAADRRLRRCVDETGHKSTAELMYLTVRFAGHPWWPFSWRWGYGWDWPYSYDDSVGRPLLRGSDEDCAPQPDAAPSSAPW